MLLLLDLLEGLPERTVAGDLQDIVRAHLELAGGVVPGSTDALFLHDLDGVGGREHLSVVLFGEERKDYHEFLVFHAEFPNKVLDEGNLMWILPP